ncbi:MAG: MFS transporter [Candidatus Methylomirabilia bacterium]
MTTRRARATLGACSATHFIHDGFSDALYVLFPLWAAELTLSFTQVGLMRMVYSGAMASFQVPAGLLAERWGEIKLLAGGTAAVALGYLVLGWTGSFGAMLGVLLAAGLGSGVQHPLSSALVSKAYEVGPRRMALGTYNFSGDLGKVTVPAVVAAAISWVGWRWATQGYGVVGLVASAAILVIFSRLRTTMMTRPMPADKKENQATGWGIRDTRGFQALAAIAILDQSTRTALLTFLPFLLMEKGLTVSGVGLALALIFTGGAVGKFVCGALAERIGVVRTVVLTELATGGGILLLPLLPLSASLLLLPLLGVALNGTSSVLYGTVADLVLPERRSRAYGLFYTLGIGSGALAPTAYGLLSDWAGVSLTLRVIGLVVLITIPLTRLLRVQALSESAHV